MEPWPFCFVFPSDSSDSILERNLLAGYTSDIEIQDPRLNTWKGKGKGSLTICSVFIFKNLYWKGAWTCKWWQVQVWISKLEWKGRVQPSALFLRPRLPSLSIWSQPATPKPPAIHCYQEQTLLPSLSSIIISFLVALTWHMSGYIHCLTPPILKRILVQNTNFC